MAYANTARFGYRQGHNESEISNKPHPYFDDSDSGILEPDLLDTDTMQNPEAAQLHKASFVPHNGILSPADSHVWAPQYDSGFTIDPVSAGSTSFNDDHEGFGRGPAPQVSAFIHPAQSQQYWPYEQRSGNCTPTGRMDFHQPPPNVPFDQPHYVQHRTDSARGSFSQPPHPVFNGPEDGFIPAPHVQTPVSPHSHQQWMDMAAREVESRPSRRARGQSPPRTTIDYQRGDGIRKKNARIEIPQERSIQTIEHLLETTTDEDLLKELKQQKRLLRNREAALASRQRKKKHTEDLESKEKGFTRTLDDFQSQIDGLQHERHNLDRNYQILNHQYQESQRIVETLQDEKRDMIMKHTEETSTLRKRIHALTDQLENGPAPAMSAVPSSAGFTDFNAEMEALTMDTHDWENYIFVDGLHDDALDDVDFESKMEPARPSLVTSKKTSDNTTDQHVSSGLLFFLLLCGAFVASKPAESHPRDLPKVPEDVRAAAPMVLNNLLSETQPSATSADARTPRIHPTQPGPSGLHNTQVASRSRLDRIHHRLTAPTRQQEIESAFSLTPAEYASMANIDYPLEEERPSRRADASPRTRRPLAETLASMQDEHARNSKAEVYTRSLLWDQIPADVVKQFRELVRDHNEIETRHQKQQRRQDNDDMRAFKVET